MVFFMNVALKEPVSIIIPVHNRKQITLKCLENLDKSGDLQQYHVVVVDDGSTDGTTEAINSSYPDVTVLSGDGNLWWTGGIKKGMEYAYEQGAEYFVWLNDDCLVTEKAIPDLVAFCRQSSLNIIGCQGYELDKPNQIAFGGMAKTVKGYRVVQFLNNQICRCDMLTGNIICFSQKLIQTIGYPDAKNFPHYGGDTIYLIRAIKAGFNIFVDTSNVVFNIYGKSKVAPNSWLLQEGNPFSIIKLIFNPTSILNWRVNFLQYWEDYSLVGIILFSYKYLLDIFFPILIITILRFLPLYFRKQLSDIKQTIITT